MSSTAAEAEDGAALHWTSILIILGVPVLLFAATNAIVLFMPPELYYLGVFRGDQFYYLANAREIFESGNGIFYSDPFWARFDGPRVFSHLELLLFGWTWRLTGLPLPQIWQGAQVLFGALMLLSLHRLLACVVERRQLAFTFGVLALAGGAEWISALVTMSGAPVPVSYLRAFDLFRGTAWLPNVFQNVPFATQSFYHAIAFATFAAVLKDRRGLALLGLFLVWWSHPWTGLQATAILGVHAAIESLTTRRLRAHQYTAGVAVIGGLFVGYYLVGLPLLSDEAADIARRWRGFRLAVLDLEDVPAMWGVFLLWPLFFLKRTLRPVDLKSRKDRFLCTWVAVVAVLLFHDRLLPASIPHYQPAHFAHGYLFVPMAIFTLRGLAKMTVDWPSTSKRVGASLFLLLAVVDNVTFTVQETLRPYRPSFTDSEVRLVEFLEEQEPGLVLIDDLGFTRGGAGGSRLDPSILSVLTPHRYYLYNRLQTPWFEQKLAAAQQMLRSPNPAEQAASLGLRWIVQNRSFEPLGSDARAGNARVVFRNDRYRVIEVLAPAEGASARPTT